MMMVIVVLYFHLHSFKQPSLPSIVILHPQTDGTRWEGIMIISANDSFPGGYDVQFSFYIFLNDLKFIMICDLLKSQLPVKTDGCHNHRSFS